MSPLGPAAPTLELSVFCVISGKSCHQIEARGGFQAWLNAVANRRNPESWCRPNFRRFGPTPPPSTTWYGRHAAPQAPQRAMAFRCIAPNHGPSRWCWPTCWTKFPWRSAGTWCFRAVPRMLSHFGLPTRGVTKNSSILRGSGSPRPRRAAANRRSLTFCASSAGAHYSKG